ncbi:MAG: ATP-binding protein [Bacteroidetes bacterium]|nr:ATP-binding protein [Bacteroidota bacterium]
MQQIPQWVEQLSRLYFTKTISQFILHGNLVDYVPHTREGQTHFLKLHAYLGEVLFRKRDFLITYDRASGIRFATDDMTLVFIRYLENIDKLFGTTYAKTRPRNPAEVFGLLENFIRLQLQEGKRIALVIDYAETLAPAGNPGSSSAEDRAVLVYLLRWAKDSLFLNHDMTTVLLADNVQSINPQLVRSPFTAEIEIPLPDEAERLQFCEYMVAQHPGIPQKMEMDLRVLAQHTAGLSRIQLKTLLAEIHDQPEVFGFDRLMARKKGMIEAEAGGLLSFVETRFGLEDVAGHAAAKRLLRAAAQALQNGRPDVMPMGYLVNGPVGTGKTFLISCFATDIGVPMVELKNFRSQWQGVTEANLEKVLKLLKAMSPIAVMIDEADAYLGNRNSSGDSGVSSRVFSMIASFMSNTEHRGKIIWFLLTARPDLMPVDLKRQGRAEEHIALFYPETIAEKKELFAVMLKKTKIKGIDVNDFPDAFYENLPVRSGADMEASLTRAKFRAAAQGIEQPDKALIEATLADFVPPNYPEEVELMNLAAVLECTSKDLLPESYRHLDRAEVAARVRELKDRLGR